jgi:hypothetical protein
MGVDTRQHGSRICHARKISPNVNRICAQKGDNENQQKPSWKSLLEVPGKSLSCYLANAGTHHLDRSHQGPRYESSP